MDGSTSVQASSDQLTARPTPQGRGGTRLRLVALWEGGAASVTLTDQRAVVIGRSRDCDIVVEHPSVSRRHARLWLQPRSELEDLGSVNGTRLGGVLLKPGARSPFRPGDLVEIGRVVLALQAGSSNDHEGASPPLCAAISGEASPIILEDPRMRAVDGLVQMLAPGDLSVLLLGETGVGKDVWAHRLHVLSRRASAPFVRINCAALAETLLESELFGHARGAFTGAVAAKKGLIEAAHGGTLFLDEVGDLPWLTQAKLLRVLESREVQRIGEVAPRAVDVRVVGATNRPLAELVQSGAFRSDLYFRLNGISLTIPPLRERPQEVIPLARHLLGLACRRAGLSPPVISSEARRELLEHRWPGNVRELRNVLERALVLAPAGILGAEHILLDPDPLAPASGSLPAARPASDSLPPSSGATLKGAGVHREDAQAAERSRIVAALEQAHGNQSRAAVLLGISRRTLTNKLNTFELPRPRKGRSR